jgi:hypothetical protein
MTASANDPFNIAVISTAFYLRSHTDVLVTRWTKHRPGDAAWGWDGPSSHLASIHIEQTRENDIGVAWAKENNVPLMATIEEALTLGQNRIAVQGVLLIGEHGDYPHNEFGQKEYPRKRLFDSIVAVYRKYGKSLPIMVDKHYSYDAKWAHEMVDTAKAMGFPLLGGSSIPHVNFQPRPGLKPGFEPVKALAVYYGDNEAYLYHSIEFSQSILEKRKGGEPGIKAVTAWEGEEVWPLVEKHFGDNLTAAAVSSESKVKAGDMKADCAAWTHKNQKKGSTKVSPVLTILHYADGFDAGHLNLNGHVQGWSMAVETANQTIHPVGTVVADEDLWYAHFATFAKLCETFLMTGKYPFAPERALLTTCATAASMHALHQPGVKYDSPLARVAYKPFAHDVIYNPQAR